MQEEKTENGSKPLKKSDRTRERILQSAMELMPELGFQGATIREICDRAGVSVGTFYIYFQTKSDLLRDIFESADTFFTEVVAADMEGKSCLEQLRVFTARYAELNENTGLDMLEVLFNPENELLSRTRPMQDMLLAVMRQGQTSGILKSGLTAERLVEDLFWFLRGVIYSWCVFNASFDLRARMREALELFLYGAARDGGAAPPSCQ